MSKNYTRRQALKSTVYGATLSGVTIGGLSRSGVATNGGKGPKAESRPNLFRLIDSGVDAGKTTIRILRDGDKTLENSFVLKTKGTNHPDIQGLSHQNRFPHVARDIDSFGEIQKGRYVLEAERDGIVNKIPFQVGMQGIIDGNVIHALILPNDEMRLYSTHSDPVK